MLVAVGINVVHAGVVVMLITINGLKSLRKVLVILVVVFFVGAPGGYSPLYANLSGYDGEKEARRDAERNIITTVPEEEDLEEDNFNWDDSNFAKKNTGWNSRSDQIGSSSREFIQINNRRDAVSCNRSSGGTDWSALSNAVLKFGLLGMGFYGMYTSHDIARRNIRLKEGFLSNAMAKSHGNFQAGQGFFGGGAYNPFGISGLGGLYGSLNGFSGGLNFGLGGQSGYGYGGGGSYPYNSGYPGNNGQGCYYCRPIGPMGSGGGVYPNMMQAPIQGRKP